jgi:hypothetical protein
MNARSKLDLGTICALRSTPRGVGAAFGSGFECHSVDGGPAGFAFSQKNRGSPAKGDRAGSYLRGAARLGLRYIEDWDVSGDKVPRRELVVRSCRESSDTPSSPFLDTVISGRGPRIRSNANGSIPVALCGCGGFGEEEYVPKQYQSHDGIPCNDIFPHEVQDYLADGPCRMQRQRTAPGIVLLYIEPSWPPSLNQT